MEEKVIYTVGTKIEEKVIYAVGTIRVAHAFRVPVDFYLEEDPIRQRKNEGSSYNRRKYIEDVLMAFTQDYLKSGGLNITTELLTPEEAKELDNEGYVDDTNS